MSIQHPPISIQKLQVLPLIKILTKDDAGQLLKDQAPGYGQEDLLDLENLEYGHFPALVLEDGSPWVHGNLYLLSKIIETHHNNLIDPQTLMTHARELKLFMNELHKAGLHYLNFPTRKLQRPTYFYTALLKKRVDAQEIEASTRDKKLGCVFPFYTWLKKQHDFNTGDRLWDESPKTITYLDGKGFAHQKTVIGNSLKPARSSKMKNSVEGFINDGGALRPYSKQEQETLIKALAEADNIELTLACLFSLTTSARTQTVLTLRLSDIVTIAEENGTRKFSLKIGGGTGIDTKNGKLHLLKVPEWLHYKLHVYASSPRYKARQEKASVAVRENGYVFLTEDGLPFYAAHGDKAIPEYRNIPNGDALRQTIRRVLQPILDRSETPFTFRFHDLRATFGINLVEDLWARTDKNEMTFMQVLTTVRERMGHAKLATTLEYLNYRANRENLEMGFSALDEQLKQL